MKAENITEKQVVSFLKQRQQQLLDELKSIEVTINAIAQTKSASSNDRFQMDIDGSVSLKPKKKNVKSLVPQESFNPNSKLDQKISYALTQIGTGYKDDILEVLNKAQPEADPYKVEKAVAVRLSYLLKNDFIQATKHGRSYKYSLK
ncbi:soluble adenylyl cyclase-like protein [Olivibacter sp. SDN3]|uniref:soluble adenylyl cyclase-like protein n=1 Tax=Olivibacter sp. SDN3 TaxID=2764720 RepID=UPI0016514FF0|nr:soluble adenylyl cyclase-like protein [Olivibacter sp. SDN3]QNL49683.1 soluble adenylyl cyclase-like protein [Olivibacter sp. SDN3]